MLGVLIARLRKVLLNITFYYYHKLDILLIQEVKMSLKNLITLATNVWPGVEFLYSEASGAFGGISIL